MKTDSSEELKHLQETADTARQEVKEFIGKQDSVAGDFDEQLGKSKSNIDYQSEVDHVAKAHGLTSVGAFNFQNKILILLGALLSLLILVPITSFIMIYDLKQIIDGFEGIYEDYTFTVVLIVGAISTIMLGLTEFLFLGGFNKKNKKTRKLEKILLFLLLFVQLGSHAYFAYLITGTQNTVKKEKLMKSSTSTEGIVTEDIDETKKDIQTQIENLNIQLKDSQDSYRTEKSNKAIYEKKWNTYNNIKKPSRAQIKKRRNFYTLKKDCKKNMDKETDTQKELNEQIKDLRTEKTGLSSKLASISTDLDKKLDESGFWRIIYTFILLLLFEGLSHIHWLAFYRIIKNADPNLVEDYDDMGFMLKWQDVFSSKSQEATMALASQQMRIADNHINNMKLVGKSMEYTMGANSATMIELTKAGAGVMGASVSASRKATQGTLFLAKTIDERGFQDIEHLGYEPNAKIAKGIKTEMIADQTLIDALAHVADEFGEPPPNIGLIKNQKGGYFDILQNRIVIGENEPDKLIVLAHEFVHYLGYITHSKEFKDMEETVIKGLTQWYKTQK